MKLTLDMPEVSKCDVVQCGYNVSMNCHAKAITIGDSKVPECDTFFKSQTHNKDTTRTAGVGACKVSGCKHNIDFECVADKIAVGILKNKINCITYSAR